jgi:hypothetical protein
MLQGVACGSGKLYLCFWVTKANNFLIWWGLPTTINSTFILPTAHESMGSNLGMSNYSLPPYGVLILLKTPHGLLHVEWTGGGLEVDWNLLIWLVPPHWVHLQSLPSPCGVHMESWYFMRTPQGSVGQCKILSVILATIIGGQLWAPLVDLLHRQLKAQVRHSWTGGVSGEG